MLGNIANNIVGLVMIGITLAVVIAFLVWYYRNRQERLFLQRSMDNNELVGIMPRYWKPLDVLKKVKLMVSKIILLKKEPHT